MIKDRQFETCDQEFFTVYSADDYLDQSAYGCWRTFEIDPNYVDLQVDSWTGKVTLANTLSPERV